MNLAHRGFAVLIVLSLSLAGCAGRQSAGAATAVQTGDEASTERLAQPSSTPESESTDSALDAATASPAAEPEEQEAERPEGWTEETHSKDAEPNCDVVFPQDQVNEITITIASEDWEAMQANLVELLGAPGQGGGAAGDRQRPAGMQGGPGQAGMAVPSMDEGTDDPAEDEQAAAPIEGERPAMPGQGGPGGPMGGEMADGDAQALQDPPIDGQVPMGGGRAGGPGGGLDVVSENPMWVPATITFNGLTWNYVGVRYKGNSSLQNAWNSGGDKLPLKLDFDEFEDDYPEIDDQRFYGFKQLSFANCFSDDSYLRDAIAANLLDRAGLPAARTAFYQVYLDYGEGVVDLGLYTAIEVIDDTAIPRYFGTDDGTIYEAEGTAASLAAGTEEQIETSFQKENNEDEADWSDIQALYDALHAETRTTDAEAWRADLESVLDVDSFLEWLAAASLLQHWDSYGGMAHNYYLYHDPETDLLTWISWDHNQILSGGSTDAALNAAADGVQPPGQAEAAATDEEAAEAETATDGTQPIGPGGPGGQQLPNADGAAAAENDRLPVGVPGRGGMGGGNRNGVTIDRADVGDDWPLIRYLLDDPVYWAAYVGYVQEVAELMEPEDMAARYDEMAAVIAAYIPEDEADSFEEAIATLKDRTQTQYDAAQSFLAEQQE